MYEQGRRDPDATTLKKIASFFNVTTDYLLGNDAPASSTLPPLTPKDEREIRKDLEDMIYSLSGSATMGDPEDEEDLEMLKASLKQALMLSKRIAKKKFTPKKYRKD
jgi:transcriptional regulator with XRE-family HTH domain